MARIVHDRFPEPVQVLPESASQACWFLVYLFCLVFAISFWRPVSAADWSMDKSIEIGVVHSDSLTQAETDTRQSSTTGTVKPTISLTGRGNNTTVLLLTEIDYLKSEVTGDQVVLPRLYGTFESTLLDRTFFLDGNLTVDRVIVGSERQLVDSLDLDNDFSTTANLSVSPSLALELADVADLAARYTFNSYSASSDDLLDSQSNGIDINLDSKVSSNGYQVGAGANVDNTTFAQGSPLRRSSITANAGKQWGKDWNLSASIGREWNEVPDQSVVAESETPLVKEQATIWDLGLSWKPGRRTSLFAGYGERSFGRRPSVEFTHRARRSTYSLAWSRDLTRSSSGLFEAITADLPADADPLEPDLISDSGGNTALFLEDTVIAVSEQVRATYLLRGRTSSLSVESIYSQRESRFQTASFNSTTLQLISSLERRIGRDLSVKFTYEHARGKSESRVRENRIGISLKLAIR